MVELTPRQIEILRLVANGNSNKTIAYHLGISRQTVKNHLWMLYDKLFTKDYRYGQQGRRTLAARYALQTGQLKWKEIEGGRNYHEVF
jgi:two-component system NarL family response regulator